MVDGVVLVEGVVGVSVDGLDVKSKFMSEIGPSHPSGHKGILTLDSGAQMSLAVQTSPFRQVPLYLILSSQILNWFRPKQINGVVVTGSGGDVGQIPEHTS